MRLYKPNPRGTGSACSFSVTSTGNGQGVYLQIVKQIGWDDAKKTGSFDKKAENKIHLKFTPTEVAGMMIVCQKQNGTAKFFHNTGTITSSISFGVWEKDGVKKGISLAVSKGEKKAQVPITFDEAFLLARWFDFALDRIFTADYTEEKKRFQEKNKKVSATEIDL